MALSRDKGSSVFLTTCDSGSSVTGFLEFFGDAFEVPETERKVISSAGRQGTGEFGFASTTTAIMSTFNLKGYKFAEFAVILARSLAKGYVPSGVSPYVHGLHSIDPAVIALPTFAIEKGDGTTNNRYTNCVINNVTITANNDDTAAAEITAEGFCNAHSNIATLNTSGSISSGSIDIGAHPILNLKAAKVWIGGGVSSGALVGTTVDFTGSNLQDPVDITTLLNSFTFNINNNITPDKLNRAGSQILNIAIAGDRTGSFEMQVNKDASVYDFDSKMAINDTTNSPLSLEIQFYGYEIADGDKFALTLILNKVNLVQQKINNLETPETLDLTFNLHERDNSAVQCFVQDSTNAAYNS